MKTKDVKTETLVKLPESAVMALVLSQLRGVDLFPEKIASAKKYLKRMNKK